MQLLPIKDPPSIKRYRRMKWLGTAFQLAGCIILALNVPWSGWAFPLMLYGSLTWLGVAIRTDDDALAGLNLAFTAINALGIWRWLT